MSTRAVVSSGAGPVGSGAASPGCAPLIGSRGGLLQSKIPPSIPVSSYATRSAANSSQCSSQAEREDDGVSPVELVFKQPKSTLHNFYDILSSKLKNPNYRLTINFKSVKLDDDNAKTAWNCTYCVKWPLEKTFTAQGANKADSSTRAALQALGWLRKADIIDGKGRPILGSGADAAKLRAEVEKAGSGGREGTGGAVPGRVSTVQPEPGGRPGSDKVTSEATQSGTTAGKLGADVGTGDAEHVAGQPRADPSEPTVLATTAGSWSGVSRPGSDDLTDQKSASSGTGEKVAAVNNTSDKSGSTNQPGVKKMNKAAKTQADCNASVISGVDPWVQRMKQPKSTLHNLYVSVANELKRPDLKLQQSYHMVTRTNNMRAQMKWTCTYVVRWPSEARFVGDGDNKASAARHAALQALSWLKDQGKITKDGLPVVHSLQEVRQLKKSLLECRLDEESASAVGDLLDSYSQDVQHILEPNDVGESYLEDEDYLPALPVAQASGDEGWQAGVSDGGAAGPALPRDPITGGELSERSGVALERRSEELLRRLARWDRDPTPAMLATEEARMSLPVFQFRGELCRLVEDNRVLVVKGEPGCGKSTQVPQFLLEHWTMRGRGALCNIVVTQPRRISAISVAKFVASQRHEQLGDVVGYQVRLSSVLPRPPGGALLFCSTGILLQRLKDNPALTGLSHVVLDEAHERDLNTDMLLVLLRRALHLNPRLHVVVMSATINPELLQAFFGGAPALHVPGFTHPVKQHFLEDLRVPDLKIKAEMFSHATPVIDADETAKVIHWVDKNRPSGAILCFLPGWAEIKAVTKSLQKLAGGFGYVLPLHSRLSDDDQKRIFSPPPLGLRKIILSTNIAETSLTIDDVVYVVDCGAHKEERLSVDKAISSLDNQWVSQASVKQRKGRAGRVRPGESYHLYPRAMYHRLDMYPVPEVLRVPLEKTILDIKAYKDDKIDKFLLEMPEPPSSEAVLLAVNELTQLGILDSCENLTSLGQRIVCFTTHPKLSKILVYAAVFRCLAPALTISTLLSNDVDVFHGGLEAKEAVRKCKASYSTTSDHLALAWLYQQWHQLVEESLLEPVSFCRERNLNHDNLHLARKLRRLVAEHLVDAGMVRDVDGCSDLDAPCNQHASNHELVKAVLLSGFNTLLHGRGWDVSRGRLLKNKPVLVTESGLRATVTNESVNSKRTQFSTPFLTYFRQVLSTERRATIVRETSLVSPFAIFLFKPGELLIHDHGDARGRDSGDSSVVLSLKGKRTTAVLCSQRDATLLCKLRCVMWRVVEFLVREEGRRHQDYQYRAVLMFHDKLLHAVSRLLSAGQEDQGAPPSDHP